MSRETWIAMARADDVDAFVDHVVYHVTESGREGAPHFALSRTLVRDEVRTNTITRWAKRLDEPLWGRSWLLWTLEAVDGPPRRKGAPGCVVGHVDLRGGRLPAELHRATLGMGIQRAFTSQGLGRRLVDASVVWARHADLAFIDLGVFTHNQRARRLYTSAGFTEVGVRPDAFRIDSGQTVDDVAMVLDLQRRRDVSE